MEGGAVKLPLSWKDGARAVLTWTRTARPTGLSEQELIWVSSRPTPE
ncbi:hypothetical protein A2U01_0105977, partial [Trifolium medium]|nr:hypothetical protein [Trifolium medium]